jgi:hypothetical protein
MKGRSVHDLLRDYQTAIDRAKQLPADAVRELRDFERFLVNRQHVLMRDPAQLWSQAAGQARENAVGQKTRDARGPEDRWWFRAVHPLPESMWEMMIEVKAQVCCIALLEQDGRRIALAGCGDGVIRRYDLRTGEELNPPLAGHLGWVTAVAWSADGRHALSGSSDHTLRWWDVEQGRCLHTLEGHSDKVTTVALRATAGTPCPGRRTARCAGGTWSRADACAPSRETPAS